MIKYNFEKLNIKNKDLSKFIISFKKLKDNTLFFNDDNYLICTGFCDVHVHLREPGFSYKEKISTATKAAAHGGFTTILSMPNTNPSPYNYENLKIQLDLIKNNSIINVIPYGRITNDSANLSNMAELRNYVCAYSDDGKGVQDSNTMEKAMIEAKLLNKMIVAHCEDNSLLKGGCIHEGEWAKKHNFVGISSASEYSQLSRDIELVRKTRCKYHVCHVSTKESVELIRKAKLEGLDITCETAPHYLLLTENDLVDKGCFKMNPPLRSDIDRNALIEGIVDGTIDIIATDHAPHSLEEKNKGLKGSLFGVVGLETAFAKLYTELVKKDIISLGKLINLMIVNPKKRFNVCDNGFTIFDLSSEYKIDPNNFFSMGKSTPFENDKVFGKCILTVINDKIAFKDTDYIE